VKPVEAREFVIPFIGFSLGVHHFKYEIASAFFDDYPEQEFRDPRMTVSLSLEKKSNNTMDLHLRSLLAEKSNSLRDVTVMEIRT